MDNSGINDSIMNEGDEDNDMREQPKVSYVCGGTNIISIMI